jgi:hypothetical protein
MTSVFGAKSVLPLITSCKQDCLAKLLEYDMVPEGLPVGLGGSWTNGCEPWRKGNPGGDELALEIELDLSCLVRTALWRHAEVVAAEHIDPLTSATAVAVAVPAVGSEVVRFVEASPTRTQNAGKMITNDDEPPEDEADRKMPPAVNTTTSTTVNQQHQAKRYRSVDSSRRLASPKQGPAAAAGAPASSSGASTAETNNMSTPSRACASAAAGADVAADDDGVAPAPSRSKLIETIAQRDARRAKENYYAKRKREREKHLVEGLMEEQGRLTTSNDEFRVEGERLQGLLDAAQRQLAGSELRRHQSNHKKPLSN